MPGPRASRTVPEPGRKKSAKSSERRWFHYALWWAFNLAFWATLAAVIAGGLYAFSIDHDLTAKFEGKRWKLPTHVYSDSLTMLPGSLLLTTGVLDRLQRLDYQSVDHEPARPGEFFKSPTALWIYLRKFTYPGEIVQPRLVKITLNGDVIAKVFDLTKKEEMPMVEVEPELIGRFFGQVQEERRLIPWAAIPKSLVWSVAAVEDAAFFEHHGINVKGVFRALLKGLIRFKIREGGSGLTQQLVKNMYLSPERTLTRKGREAVMAIVLEMHYPKEKIFEVYINEIYFGQSGSVSICGLGEAAWFYFGKNPEELTLAESALLASLIRSPTGYNPRKFEERARIRRDYILDRLAKMPEAMAQLHVTAADLVAAKTQTLSVNRHMPSRTIAPFFIDFLRQQLTASYGEDVLQSEGLAIYTTLDVALQRMAERAVQKSLAELEASAKSLVANDDNRLQAALIALEPSTGYVRAMVGGRDYAASPFNRAVQMRRQVGSAFKPFVYTAAFLRAYEDRNYHFTGATMLKDEPLTIPSGGKPWSPQNFDGKFEGDVTVRHALEHSRNVPTARVALDVGLDRVIAAARQMGVIAKLEPYPSLALGVAEMSPLELAASYAPLASQGYYCEPIAIRDVVDRNGRVLEKRGVKPRRALPTQVAYLVTHILEGVLETGTAAGARRMGLKIPAAGKTGTTNEGHDAWFVGYTPSLLAATWVGFDREKNVGLTGARAALPIWTRFMIDYARGQQGDAFEPPPGIVFRKIDERSGLLAHYDSPETADEAFLEGAEPRSESPLNRDSVIDFFRQRK
jgi:penicillin-binding protein 1B